MRKPEYSHEKWQSDWEENQKFMDNISAFPPEWWVEVRIKSEGWVEVRIIFLFSYINGGLRIMLLPFFLNGR